MTTFKINKILVPIDFSATSLRALSHAEHLAMLTEAEITLIYVCEDMPDAEGFEVSPHNAREFVSALEKAGPKHIEHETRLEAEAMKHLQKLAIQSKEKGVLIVNCIIEKDRIDKKICETAASINADIIIMGTHGIGGFTEHLLGSNTYRVVRKAHCPVLAMQQSTDENDITNILIPFQDKPHSREGVDYAIQIAITYGASIHVLGVCTDPAKSALRKMEFEVQQTKDIIETWGITCTTEVLTGSYESNLIIGFAESKKADMIVIMADVDKDRVSEYIDGPVVKQIVNHTKIPILSIPHKYNPKLISSNADWKFWD